MSNKIILECNKLTLTRGNNCLLSNANISINQGEIIWLMGSSGSGKTSFAECLSGKLYCDGQINFNWDSSLELANQVSYVSQFSQFKDKQGQSDFYYQQRFNSYDADMTVTVREELDYLFNNSNVIDNLQLLINLFKFENKLSSSLLHLSSGERKKLQLIKTLANPSQLIILDNPLTGLDKLSMVKLEEYITKLSIAGITFIIIDRINYVFASCPAIVLIDGQKLVKLSVDDYLNKYSDNDNIKNSVDSLNFKLLPLEKTYQNIVEFKDVLVKYSDKVILSGINWQIKAGQKWLLEGENGAGKSTVISLINGDNPQAYANDIWMFDRKRGSGETIWDIKSKIGYISPELQWNFARNLTCLEVVLSGYFDTPGLYSKATSEQINYAKQVLESVNLSEFANTDYISVANGVQRSILLVRALIKNPPLLIFDEPCQGMSESQSHFFVQMIDKLFNGTNHTIIYITHRTDEMPKCLTNRLTISNGAVIRNEEINEI